MLYGHDPVPGSGQGRCGTAHNGNGSGAVLPTLPFPTQCSVEQVTQGAAMNNIARRLVSFACDTHGLPQSDLMIDPLTFTVATGNEDDRKLGQWTLEAACAVAAMGRRCCWQG